MGENKKLKSQKRGQWYQSSQWIRAVKKQLLKHIKSSQKSAISVNKLYCVGHKPHGSQ